MSNPNWMEDVAQSGGFAQHHIKNLREEIELKKAEAELYKQLKGIKKEQWSEMGKAFSAVKEVINMGGFGELIGQSFDRFSSQLQSSLDKALAPLQNTFSQFLDQLFDIPLIKDTMTGVVNVVDLGLSNFGDMLTGNWDKIANRMGEIQHLYNLKQQIWYEASLIMAQMYEQRLTELTGYTYAQLDASGTAGGVYSGQMDLDVSAYEDIGSIIQIGTW